MKQHTIYKLILLYILWGIFIPIGKAQPFLPRQWDYKNGLSNNYVHSLTYDKRGYLWIATEEGLNRFDGVNFKNYFKHDRQTLSLTGNELNCVMDDPSAPKLWIGTQRFGLNCYDYAQNTFHVFRSTGHPDSLVTNDVTALYPDAKGNLWVGTYWQGVDYYDKTTNKFIHYNQSSLKGFPSNHIQTVYDDGQGNLYVGHYQDGLTVLNPHTRTFRHYTFSRTNPQSLPDNSVNSIFRDHANRLWIGCGKGLCLFIPSSGKFLRVNTLSHSVFDIIEPHKGELWIAMEQGGIVILHTDKLAISSSTTTIQLPENTPYPTMEYSGESVRCLHTDNYGNVWAGVWGRGINMFSHTQPFFSFIPYSPIPSPQYLSVPTVLSVCEDTKGRLWIGTDGDGVNVFAHGLRITTLNAKTEGWEGNSVQCAYRDKEGNLWFGCYYGGTRFVKNGTLQSRQVFSKALSHTDTRCFFEEGTRMWIGTSDGLYAVDKKSLRVTEHRSLTDNLVRCMTKDTRGNYWIGTFGSGIHIYSPQWKEITNLRVENQFPSNTIHQFLLKDGELWAATAEGIVSFPASGDYRHYTLYNKEYGLNNAQISALVTDRNGNLWIGTNHGISCLLKKEKRVLNYAYQDNIPMGSCSPQAAYQGHDNQLYFGTINGLCYFSPTRLLSRQPSTQTFISSFSILGTLQESGDDEQEVFIKGGKVELSHEENSFRIRFNTRNFALSPDMEYSYMLKGWDNEWYKAEKTNSLSFRNVPPGHYTLLLRSRLRNHSWNPQLTQLSIHITPPWWASWWAYTFYALLVIAILYASLRFWQHRVHLQYLYDSEKSQRKHEEELNQERLRFYTNIAHELRTPLTLIIGPLEDETKSSTLAEKDRKVITLIHKNALRLLELINRLMEFRKTETDNRQLKVTYADIRQTIQDTVLKYKELRKSGGVRMQILLPHTPVKVYYDPEALTLILDNLLSNAFKYTSKGSVMLSLVERKDEVDICVTDTGCGISPEALPHVFERYYREEHKKKITGTGIGLALVKKLAELHQGRITVESQQGTGSSFHLFLQTANTYPEAIHLSNSTPTVEKRQTLPPAGKQTLLIVEDDKDIQSYIASAFTDTFLILTADNGKQGWEMAKLRQPDMVVSDVMMPEMDGFTLCRKLKGDVETSHIPVILLTAKDMTEDRTEGYQCGADSYLTKPFSATLLKSRVENLLAQRVSWQQNIQTQLKAGEKTLQEKRDNYNNTLNEIDKRFILQIDKLIKENLSTGELDVAFLADRIFMSQATLYRKMKSLTGLSTNEYIRSIRMQEAERMLIEGKWQTTEIARHVGFDNLAYFRKCFKKEFGMTPSEYVNALKPQ